MGMEVEHGKYVLFYKPQVGEGLKREEKSMSTNSNGGYLTPEIRLLDAKIAGALGVPDAAFVISFDSDGIPVIFEWPDTKDGTYPVQTKSIVSAYMACFYAYSGSKCVDRVDSTGKVRRHCRP